MFYGMRIKAADKFKSDTELKKFYEEFGFVAVSAAVPSDLLETVKNELEVIYSDYGTSISSAICNLNATDKPLLHKIHIQTYNLFSLNQAFQSAAQIAQKLVTGIRPLHVLSSGYLLGIPKDQRLAYDFHQESNYMKGFSQIINLHFPLLGKTDMSNGTMSVLAKSHKLGNLDYNTHRSSDDSYTDLIPVDIDEIVNNFEELHLELNTGDCVFFDGNLIHRSNFNSTNNCRLAGVVRLTTGLSLND